MRQVGGDDLSARLFANRFSLENDFVERSFAYSGTAGFLKLEENGQVLRLAARIPEEFLKHLRVNGLGKEVTTPGVERFLSVLLGR